MNADGSGSEENLTNNQADDINPEISPDGTRIAFSSNRRKDRYNIYLINTDGSGTPARLAGTGKSDYGPDFSPDGQRIAFYSHGGRKTGTDIFTMEADGTSVTRLTTARRDDTIPSWGPAMP